MPFAKVEVAEPVWLMARTLRPPVKVEVPVPRMSMIPVVVALPPKKELPLTENLRVGEVVPTPTLPSSRMVKRDVEALFAKLARIVEPVPVPHTVSFEYGVEVPIPNLLFVSSKKKLVLSSVTAEPEVKSTEPVVYEEGVSVS